MKKVLVSAVLALVAVGAFAQKAAPKEIACAVMKESKVDIKTATKAKMYADYKGRRYFFCCDGCPAAFKKDPAKYKKSASIALPKKKGKKV